VTLTKIALSIEERIATLTLRDPKRLNAMSLSMREECLHALRELEAGDEADCVILTGEGRAFSAGADLDELAQRTAVSELSTSAQVRRELPRLLETLRMPSLAAINGYCFGAGLEVALACTLRIAAESAKLGLPEIKLGVIPGSGGTQRLARVVGMGRAMEMVTLGEPVTAARAYEMGLVNAVHPDAELRQRALALCRQWQAKGAVSLMAARDAVLRSAGGDLQAGIDYENKLFALCLTSGERDEGVRAFREKRPPQFRRRIK
jgi:enoyl-CoA hydratase/carnithine racemase